jgi:hypothetical protein
VSKQYRAVRLGGCAGRYNLPIPTIISNLVSSLRRAALRAGSVGEIVFLVLALLVTARASDWSAPEQQLTEKILALTGSAPVSVSFENRSSLTRRDLEIVQNGLLSALKNAGLHITGPEQASSSVAITFSENVTSYVWLAEIRRGQNESQAVLVSLPRQLSRAGAGDSVPLSLRKIPIWSQPGLMLDVAVLEENSTPTRIAVLEPEKLSVYRFQGGRWFPERAFSIAHAAPWPRDLRGRLFPSKDHLGIFLPGVACEGSGSIPTNLNCRQSDDPWPLVVPALTGLSGSVFPSAGTVSDSSATLSPTSAFFASSRNFFTGTLTSTGGKSISIAKFYSAAPLPHEKSILWLFAALDDQLHVVDGSGDRAIKLNWGSDIASVKTSCGAGWQVMATGSIAGAPDSVRAFEVPERDPVPVSGAVGFAGPISALWTEARGDTAIAIVRNEETGGYEAFRLAMACGQ